MVKFGRFYFEKKWLCQETFRGVLHKKWLEIDRRATNKVYSLDRWNGCIAFLSGWGVNMNGEYKKKKKGFS